MGAGICHEFYGAGAGAESLVRGRVRWAVQLKMLISKKIFLLENGGRTGERVSLSFNPMARVRVRGAE